MSKTFKTLVVGLLLVIAIATSIIAGEVVRMANNGFTVEMSDDVD